MSTRRTAASAAGIGILASFALIAAPSWATGGTRLCVPRAEGASLVTPKHGKCKKGYKLTTLGAEGKAGAEGKQGAGGKAGSEGKPGPEGKQGLEGKAGFTSEQAEQLKALLPYIRFVGNGVAGNPTVQFSGVNVQIVNGAGKTESTNGEGNLVIGYDEEPRTQTGSHNLVLGEDQEYTSFGGIIAGVANTATGSYASVTGGGENTASGALSSVSGGEANRVSGDLSWIGGGVLNEVFSKGTQGEEGVLASIFGGRLNRTAKDDVAIP
jgi:hypothetical protein